jgi:hypothetical protein
MDYSSLQIVIFTKDKLKAHIVNGISEGVISNANSNFISLLVEEFDLHPLLEVVSAKEGSDLVILEDQRVSV